MKAITESFKNLHKAIKVELDKAKVENERLKMEAESNRRQIESLLRDKEDLNRRLRRFLDVHVETRDPRRVCFTVVMDQRLAGNSYIPRERLYMEAVHQAVDACAEFKG